MEGSNKRLSAHFEGKSRFLDDLENPDNMLYGYIYGSPVAHGRIKSIDFSEALGCEGIYAIISHKDIPGKNSMGAVFEDEPVLADEIVEFFGEAILLIAAKNRECAKRAIDRVKIEVEELHPVLECEESFELKNFPFPPLHIESGDIEKGFAGSDHIIEGELKIGGQEHFYLETNAALAIPNADGTLHVISSTQNPTENQLIIAEALKMDSSKIEVSVNAIGGGFGGKETQSNWCAVWSSLLALKCSKPVKMVMDRREDMLITGKRHSADVKYRVGFTKDGIIKAYTSRFLFDTGFSADLSRAIMERCMLHLDNCYYIPALKSDLYPCKTNRPSNTAFRGFGAPQGIAVIEHIMDEISTIAGIDPLMVRRRNFYRKKIRNKTPYGQLFKDNILERLYRDLVADIGYKSRRSEILKFNKQSRYVKRGLSVVPVKFGISFTTSFLNQGAALVNLYKDGSLTIHQGGVEMGQGLYDKMVSVASAEFGIRRDHVRIYPVNTMIIPNTSATAASTGSDINGHAIKLAIERLKKRLNEFASKVYGLDKNTIIWENSELYESGNPEKKYPLEEFVKKAYTARISLSEQAFYSTPGIFFDRELSRGNPFFYYVTGICSTEVEVDMLTGAHKILRADILHDAGESLDWEIDKGQIEGAYIQSAGWVTMEELVYNPKGVLITASPDSYKIPGIADIPEDFRVTAFKGNRFREGILGSRAIGEPPFIYGLSVWLAIKDALKSYRGGGFRFDIPATKERIVKCAYRYE
ncbi:MAG: xanthine dehydrogenase molybdopterin binding subunit [Bacteroidales bacterium]